MPSPEILRVRAACHRAMAAEEEATAELLEIIPPGTRVVVYGDWKGAVLSYSMPTDDEICVIPDDPLVLKQFAKSSHGPRGSVRVKLSSIELEGSSSPCQECGGTGSVDTGGFTPWGASIEDGCPACGGTRKAGR